MDKNRRFESGDLIPCAQSSRQADTILPDRAVARRVHGLRSLNWLGPTNLCFGLSVRRNPAGRREFRPSHSSQLTATRAWPEGPKPKPIALSPTDGRASPMTPSRLVVTPPEPVPTRHPRHAWSPQSNRYADRRVEDGPRTWRHSDR
jgi:hypothetical protein